jgi:hypothetical protein
LAIGAFVKKSLFYSAYDRGEVLLVVPKYNKYATFYLVGAKYHFVSVISALIGGIILGGMWF